MERKKRVVSSLDGIAAPARLRALEERPKEEYYLGIEPLPPESKLDHKVVSVEIKLPKLKLPKLHVLKFSRHRITYAVLGAVGVVVIIAGLMGLEHLHKKMSLAGGAGAAIKPNFQPLVPIDKLNIAKVQGATSTYDTQKHVLSYSDSIGGVGVTISQQPLPDSLKSNSGGIAVIADNLGAKVSFATKKGLVYLSTNSQTGIQTAVFTTNQLLIFIQAPTAIAQTTWATYIAQLIPQ